MFVLFRLVGYQNNDCLRRISEGFYLERFYMSQIAALIMALSVTSTSLVMAGIAGWYRGSTLLDRLALISISILIVAGSHFIPSISNRRVGWVLWFFTLLGAIYSHMIFFSYTSLLARDDHFAHSVQQTMLEQEIAANRQEIASISARPVAIVAAQLAVTEDGRIRKALSAELSEAKRVARLREQLSALLDHERVARVTSATDPVISEVARLLGSNEQRIVLYTAIGFSILIELMGAFLWKQVFLNRDDQARLESNSPIEEPILRLMKEIEAGRVKPTTDAIRVFLRCAQKKAVIVRQEILTKLRN